MSDVDIFDPTLLKKKKKLAKVEIFDPTLIEKQEEETEVFDPTERVEPPISGMFMRPEEDIAIPAADDIRLQESWDVNATGEKLAAAEIFAEQLGISKEEAFNNIDTLFNIVDPNGDPKSILQKFNTGFKHWRLAEELNDLSFKQLTGQLNFPEIYQAQIDEENAKDEPDEGKIEKLESKLKQANDVAARMEELETDMAGLMPEDARFWMPQVAYTVGQITSQMLGAMQEGFVMGMGTAGVAALAGTAAGPPGTLAAGLGGFTFGLGAGMTSYNFRQMSGTTWRKLINEGVDKRWARPIALASGAFQAAAELMQQLTFVKTIPGVGKALMKAGENAVITMAKNGTFKTLAANAADKLGKLGIVGAEEVTIELFQNVLDGISDYVAIEMENKYRKDPGADITDVSSPAIVNFLSAMNDLGFQKTEEEHPDRESPELLTHGDWRDFVKEQVSTIINMGLASFLIAVPGGTLSFSADVKTVRDLRLEEARKAQIAPPEPTPIIPGEQHPIGETVAKVQPDILLHPDTQEEVTVSPKEQAEALQGAYEAQKNVFFGRRDTRLLFNQAENRNLQTEIKVELGKKRYDAQAKETDAAMSLYTDTKNDPTSPVKYLDEVSEEDQKTFKKSQELTKEEQQIAKKIDKEYRAIGIEAQEADVIRNIRENYTNRVWERKGKPDVEVYRKFGTTTRHAKQRVFTTILEGLAKGYKLKVKGATNNLFIYKDEMIKTIENKRFLNELTATKTIDGTPLLTTKHLEGYEEIKHPNWVQWRFAGKADPNEVYGQNFFATEDGTLLEKQRLYAPKRIAKNLNNIFGASALDVVPGVKTLTKYNAIIKSWVLQSSFFHHLAFARSYYLGVGHKNLKDLDIRSAYKEGIASIENLQPELVQGVKNGLTLSLIQDWDESLLQEKTVIENFLAKNKVTKVISEKISNLRQLQADFLFGQLGAGLKAKSFLIEYKNELKRSPNEDTDVIARRVAGLINADFGGLHLERIGRNPTVQHLFRIFALAPDWTESNIRSMVSALKIGGKEETQMYQRFWGRIALKGAALTTLANFALAGGDLDEMWENYKRAWEAGDLKWMDMDITPIYEMFGGKSGQRKYLSVFGHFKDPLKFANPFTVVKAAHYKGSIAYSTAFELMAGADWAGRKFTTFRELLETGETVKWGPGRPISAEQFPSYVLSQVKGSQPVQIQNILSWITGEMEGFDAIANSLGLGVRTTYK